MKMLCEALQTRRETLGNRHPKTTTSINNLAELLADLDSAALLLCEALQTRRETLGSLHPDTLTSMYNIEAYSMWQGGRRGVGLRSIATCDGGIHAGRI